MCSGCGPRSSATPRSRRSCSPCAASATRRAPRDPRATGRPPVSVRPETDAELRDVEAEDAEDAAELEDVEREDGEGEPPSADLLPPHPPASRRRPRWRRALR